MHISVGLGLDYGVSVYPDDGEQREAMMHVADDRLYKWKTANQPRGEFARTAESTTLNAPPEKLEADVTPPPAPKKTAAAPPADLPKAAERSESERRKWERISLSGTRSYAQLQESAEKTARVLDLGYGGVALEVPSVAELGATFFAVLHVPILPPVRVSLRCIYVSRGGDSPTRIGCAFVS
jgi:hypothetical protein